MASKAVSLWIAAALFLAASPAAAKPVQRAAFGQLPDGRTVEAITLTNRRGSSATIIAYGAALQAFRLADARGRTVDVALGHRTLGEYVAKRQFFGATVGRVANRVAGGRFSLDGKTYQMPVNDGPNALHGGVDGFDKKVWQIASAKEGASSSEAVLRHVSPDGADGIPGQVDVTVRYVLTDEDELRIEYSATTDNPTVINLSSHAYWNLAGEGSPDGAMGHVMEIPADRYLPVDAQLIPTGEMRSVAGSPFDFRKPVAISTRVREDADEQIRIGRGYDHNWIVTDRVTQQPHLMARLTDPASGRSFELWSNQPGLQFYSGNFLDGTTKGKAGMLYRQGDAIVVEPQMFPDAVNRPAFGDVSLRPGQTYRNVIIYKFSGAATAQQRQARH
jgi:aldose 1-epimerase